MAEVKAIEQRYYELYLEHETLQREHARANERLEVLRKRRDELMTLKDEFASLLGVVKDDCAREKKAIIDALRPALTKHHVAPSVLAELTAESAIALAAKLLAGNADTDPVAPRHDTQRDRRSARVGAHRVQ